MNSVNWSRLLKGFPALALALVAAWLLARIGLTAWEMTRIDRPSPSAPRSAATTRIETANAPGSTLFGSPPRRNESGGAPGLLRGGDFHLRGVVASGNKRVAHAIIESGGVSGAYFAGDSVANGLSLQEVRPNEVLLRRGAEVLRLPLLDLSPGTGGGIPRNLDARPDPDNIADMLAAPPRMTLSQLLRMEPTMDTDGRMEGYRIFPRAQRALFDSLGLVSGDLVVAINGIPFDKDNIAQARDQMNNGGDMMLSIMRDGEQLEITVGSANFGLLAM